MVGLVPSKNNGEVLSFDSFSDIIESKIFSNSKVQDIYKAINSKYLSLTDRTKDSDDRTLIILRKT